MKEFILFFSICIKVCLCWHFLKQDREFQYAESIKQNPWMVIIVETGSRAVAYGALFHEKAIVTTSSVKRYHPLQLQVFANCHSAHNLEIIDYTMCKDVRNISEYDVLEKYEMPQSVFHLVVLILSRPFELTPTLNVIHFGHRSNVQLNECLILYLTSVTNPITSETGALFYPSLRWSESEMKLLNRVKNYTDKEVFPVLAGSPVICRSKSKPDKWHAISTIPEAYIENELSFESSLFPIEFDEKSVEIFAEILKTFEGSKYPSGLDLYDDNK